jgi:aminoglycoside/choline kinase family phosphotransferase
MARAEVQVKTLGQIAYESLCDAQYVIARNWNTPSWPDHSLNERERQEWEAAAQAVRAAVIEECAEHVVADFFEREIADSIRALKDKK